MRKLRVMHITHDIDLGGLQQVVYNLCKAADKNRIEISVLCLRTTGVLEDSFKALNVPVYLLDREEGRTDYFAFLKVYKLLKNLEIDVIHTHNTEPFFDGSIAALISGVKTVVHTDHARAFPDKFRYMFAEWLMSLFAYKVVGCSQDTSNNLRKYERISRRKLMTIENGIDGQQYKLSVDRSKKLAELGIDSAEFVIGTAGRLSEEKGLRYIISAMPMILEQHPKCTLLIAGDGHLRGVLEKQVEFLNVKKHVLFCGVRNDIPEILNILDVFVLPSLREGLPMAILEAMASSCPIVSSRVGGIPSVLTDEESAILVPAKSEDLLSKAINSLLSDSSLRQQLASNALKVFENRYSAEIMYEKYEKLYFRRA